MSTLWDCYGTITICSLLLASTLSAVVVPRIIALRAPDFASELYFDYTRSVLAVELDRAPNTRLVLIYILQCVYYFTYDLCQILY